MRHDGNGEVALQFVNQLLDLQGADGVKGGGRFIKQDHLRPHGDGARDAKPLLLPTRKAERGFIQTVLHFIPKCRTGQSPFNPLTHFGFGELFMKFDSEGDVIINRHRKGRGFLKDHADLGAEIIQSHRVRDDVLSIHQHLTRGALSRVKAEHPVQNAQQGGFAAA